MLICNSIVSYEYRTLVEEIIETIHCHAFAVELAAKLLENGIYFPCIFLSNKSLFVTKRHCTSNQLKGMQCRSFFTFAKTYPFAKIYIFCSPQPIPLGKSIPSYPFCGNRNTHPFSPQISATLWFTGLFSSAEPLFQHEKTELYELPFFAFEFGNLSTNLLTIGRSYR